MFVEAERAVVTRVSESVVWFVFADSRSGVESFVELERSGLQAGDMLAVSMVDSGLWFVEGRL